MLKQLLMKNGAMLITTTLLLIVLSCHKDKIAAETDLFYRWEVKSFMSIESVNYAKNESSKIILFFDNNGKYSLTLDVNHCGGNFTAGENNQIEMESPACTEICCDSAFSEKLVLMLPKVTSYAINGPVLKLHVPEWGYIECELVR